jgi:2-haloalkanoic acid dehalogenase type II
LTPWYERSKLDVDENILLASYGRHETAIQQEQPGLPYNTVVGTVLGRIADEFGIPAQKNEMQDFGDSVGLWPSFADSRDALAYLGQHFKLVAITNVDNASFARTHQSLGDPFHVIVTAEDVGSYKPALENFHFAFERLSELEIARDEILHVAQSLYHDIAPAKALGLANVWVDRQTGRGKGMTPTTDVRPDLRVASLEELVAVHRAEH